MQFDNYFSKISYYQSKGRGLSVFNADETEAEEFVKGLSQNNIPCLTIQASQVYRTNEFPEMRYEAFRHLVLIQDLELSELKFIAENLVNKTVFPTYYRNIPISFFSRLDQTAYSDVQIESSLIHNDYNEVIRLLLIEQIDALLKQTNFVLNTPADIHKSIEKITYTPIELMLKQQLEKKNITFEPQVKVGRFYADFVVELNRKRIIVECDGKDYHNPHRDKERDKEIEKSGISVLRFTGSEIYNDANLCVEKIKRALSERNSTIAGIDDELDDSQKASIMCITGPIRVLAPAGSGKTKTLINRIAHLVNSGIPENQILALAFNKKAAEEMTNRLERKQIKVSNRLGDYGVLVRTFNAFGYEIIREQLNWKFSGEDADIQVRKLMANALRPTWDSMNVPNWKMNDAIDKMLEALRRTKMELPPIDEVTIEIEDKTVPFRGVFDKYIELQNRHNFLNFDDMIYLSLRILLKDKILRQSLQNRFNYILVDEFQDLNEAQLLTMQILALPNNNLYIVGDDDQMIFGWRGAKIGHILDFPNRYSDSSDFTLSTNYRSSKRIVKHSRWLIEHNKERTQKDIKPKKDSESGVLDVRLSKSIYEQAIEAVKWIEEQRQIQKSNWRDFAILFRHHEYQFPIAMVLDSRKIPHSTVNSQRLFSKNPGKDIYSYLTVILHPNDAKPADYERILKRPGKYFTNDLISKAKDWDTFVNLNDPSIEEWRQDSISKFISQITDMRGKVNNPFDKPVKLVSAIIEEFGLRKFYKDEAKIMAEIDDAGDEIIIEIVISVASVFEDIDEFYAHVYKSVNDEYSTAEETDNTKNEVLLDTIHKCKGKQFTNVVYFNLSSTGRITSEKDLEEERRVCYVGVTRAIKNALITAPEKSYSQFLPELLKNPKFSNLSTVRLSGESAQVKANEQMLLGKIKMYEKEITDIYALYPELKGANLKPEEDALIPSLQSEIIYLIKEYPELEGAALKVNAPIFKKTFARMRLDKIRKAGERIKELQAEIEAIRKQKLDERIEKVRLSANEIDELNRQIAEIKDNDLVICRDNIEEIESEMLYRRALEGKTQEDSDSRRI